MTEARHSGYHFGANVTVGIHLSRLCHILHRNSVLVPRCRQSILPNLIQLPSSEDLTFRLPRLSMFSIMQFGDRLWRSLNATLKTFFWHYKQQGTTDIFLSNGNKSERGSVMSDSLQPHGQYSPWNSLGQNTGVGSFSLLYGIFPTKGSNPGLPRCRQILY